MKKFMIEYKGPAAARKQLCCHHCPHWQPGTGTQDYLKWLEHDKKCPYKPKKYGSTTLANQAVKNQIYKEKLAAQTEKVRCEEEKIENVDIFTYLGVTSRSDGDPLTTVKQRSGAAAKRFKALGTMWENEALPQALKIRIYEAGVISILRYGSESWTLTEQVIKHIKSFNARRLHTIT